MIKKNPLIEQAKRQWRKQEKSYEAYREEYKKIVQIVSNCFEWRTAPVLAVLEKELQSSIEQQHFERCTKLRDIYQFVQSLDRTYQHIVLKKPYTGYLAYIELIAEAWVIILLQITEGKIVDIISTHKARDEHTLNDLGATVHAEFWCTETITETPTQWFFATPSLSKISKTELITLQALITTAQQSYLQSTAHLNEENLMEQMLVALQQSYQLTRIPLHMECIDISHLGWTYISGGLSCFRGWIPDKTNYRQYKIATVAKGSSDDYQSLKEVIIRRYKLTKEQIGSKLLPDLLVIDGGKGQLGIIRELAKEYPIITELLAQIDILALGKGEARQRSKKLAWAPEVIYKFGNDREIIEYPMLYDHADQLLIKLRDEAHRFANRYRKKQEEKQWK
jgi:excinuclease ABC subunit C